MAKTFDEVVEQLTKDLDVSRVAYRKSPGMGDVPYLEGYDVIDRANDIFDFMWSFEIGEPKIERWQRPVTRWNAQTRTKDPVLDGSGNPVLETVGLVYVTGNVSVTLGDAYFTHGDIGRSIIAGDSAESLDTAIAGAATDCLKRCFRQLGAQFGNSLYDKEKRDEIKDEISQSGGQSGGSRTNGQSHASQGNGQARHSSAPRPASNPPKPAASSAPVAPPTTATAATADAYTDDQVAAAKAVVIPVGAPLAGKPMGDVIQDKEFGAYVVLWLTGEKENKSHKKFVPANTDDEAAQKAAQTLVWMMKKDKWDLKF